MPVFFVTAIGTDSGKTLASAILTEALQADYWKPIQSGHPRDTEQVSQLISNPVSVLHPEAYLLTAPLSPHASAALDGVTIDLDQIHAPLTSQSLVVEGAGGVLVPLNDRDFVIDIAARLRAEVVVVANLYLGSINHTLLTLKELQRRSDQGEFKIRGIIFNGDSNPASEQIILKHTNCEVLLHIKKEPEVTKGVVKKYAEVLRKKLNEHTQG